jgi:hypothetical protein
MLEGTPQLRKDPVYNSKNITILLFTILFKVKIQFVNEDSLIEQSPKSTLCLNEETFRWEASVLPKILMFQFQVPASPLPVPIKRLILGTDCQKSFKMYKIHTNS